MARPNLNDRTTIIESNGSENLSPVDLECGAHAREFEFVLFEVESSLRSLVLRGSEEIGAVGIAWRCGSLLLPVV